MVGPGGQHESTPAHRQGRPQPRPDLVDAEVDHHHHHSQDHHQAGAAADALHAVVAMHQWCAP
ncbi:MAG: hypothetical protein AAF467_07180 [Actinomycetota bacterium]